MRKPARTNMDAWLEQKQKELDESAADRKARVKADYEAKKQKEIESIATEWAKREYFRKATAGDMPYSEAEYVKSVWERAMFEGDLKYRMLHGQETDERKELAEFKKKQEKKKAMMLERAKAELDEILSDETDNDDNSDDDDDALSAHAVPMSSHESSLSQSLWTNSNISSTSASSSLSSGKTTGVSAVSPFVTKRLGGACMYATTCPGSVSQAPPFPSSSLASGNTTGGFCS